MGIILIDELKDVDGCINPLPTEVTNMELLDSLYFVCTLQQNRPTHGDVLRQGDETCFFAKKWVCFRTASPTKSVKLMPKWRRLFYFFQFFKKVTFCHFFDFLTLCDFLGVVSPTPWLGVAFAKNTPSSCVGGVVPGCRRVLSFLMLTKNSRVASTFPPPKACRQTISEQPQVSWKWHSVMVKGAQFRIRWRMTA